MPVQFYQFYHPEWLFLFLLLPLLFLLRRYFKKESHTVSYSSIQLLEQKDELSLKQRTAFIPYLIYILSFCLLVIALARPQLTSQFSESTSEGVDIFLVLDTSGSMQALDFEKNGKQANRLEAVKEVVKDFISKRVSDRIGLMVFGDEAYTQCPLTLDYDTLKDFLRYIKIGMAGDSTAIGQALATSLKRFNDSKSKSKIIILLTDGVNTSGDISPSMAAQIAKKMGVKVYTIGIGSDGAVPFPQKGFFGQTIGRVQLELDEETLKEIAETTGGQYFRAYDTKSLKEIYQQIDQMEKTEIEVKEYRDYEELFQKVLFLALILMATAFLLTQTFYLKLP